MQRTDPGGTLPRPSLISQYRQLIGPRATERLRKTAHRLSGLKILHVNSTRGGGVAEILSSLTPLMNDAGIETEWLVIDGSPDFFSFTKDIHNALHREVVELPPASMRLHRDVVHANGAQARLDDYDLVIVHDPQPLPLVELRGRQTWIWCCHVDLSAPFAAARSYLEPMIERYDAAAFSLPEYAQPLGVPQRFITVAGLANAGEPFGKWSR